MQTTASVKMGSFPTLAADSPSGSIADIPVIRRGGPICAAIARPFAGGRIPEVRCVLDERRLCAEDRFRNALVKNVAQK